MENLAKIKQPLLSICIPTYNRHSYLKRLLDGLLPQIIDLSGFVNIYISDNASTDATQELCSAYVEQGYEINYRRNSENKGADANISQAFSMGDGEYVWVLGDDEILYAGALAGIVSILNSANLSILYLKSEPYLSDLQDKKSISSNVICTHNSAESFSREIGILFTFISAIIVNKNEVISSKNTLNTEKLIGSNLVQLAWVFSALNSGKLFAITKEVFLAAAVNNSGGYKLFTVFGVNLVRIINDLLPDKREAADSIKKSAMWFIVDWNFQPKVGFSHEDVIKSVGNAFDSIGLYTNFVKPVLLSNKMYSKRVYFFTRVVRGVFRRLRSLL